MDCTLIGLSSFCKSNLGGLQKIEYLPTVWIDHSAYERIIGGEYNLQYTIPLLQGDWLTVPVLHQPRRWDETYNSDKQNGYYDQRVTGTFPGWTTAAAFELDKMRNFRYLLRITSKDKQKWVLGTLEHPFLFSHSHTTGAAPGDLKAAQLTWYSQTRRKCTGYMPVF